MRGLTLEEGIDPSGNVRLIYRLLARLVARSAWIRCRGCGEDAIIDFQIDRRLYGIDPAFIALLVKLAIELFKYWREKNIEVPSIIPSRDEPIDFETEDSDDI